MALVIEITAPNGAAAREISVSDAGGQVNAQPGEQYRLLDTQGRSLDQARVRRFGDDLIIEQLPGEQSDSQTVTIANFFAACKSDDQICQFHLDTLGGNNETITPNSQPIAALGNGGFLLWSAAEGSQTIPVQTESGFSFKPVVGGIAGIAVIAAGAGGGSDGASSVGSDRTPPPQPTIDTQPVASVTPVISGSAQPGSTVSLLLDLGSSGATVSYRTTADANGQWSVDTATDTPLVGTLPAAGIPIDAPSNVRAVATNAAGSSEIASGSLEVDTQPPVQTVTLDSIATDAPAPVDANGNSIAEPGLDISPGAIANGGRTNDATPTITGSVSGPLEPSDTVQILRNGQPVGTATITGLQWRFTDQDVPAGEHRYTAQVADPAGNASPASAAFSLVVDGTPPPAPTLDLIADNDIVTRAEAQAGVAVTGSAEAGSRVAISWGAITQTIVADTNGVFSAQFGVSQLPGDGRLPVQAVALDSFGNASEPAVREVFLSTGLPAAPVILVADGLLSGTDIPSINAAESAAGFSIIGTANPGNQVALSLTPQNSNNAQTFSGTVSSSGQFAFEFAPGALADDVYSAQSTVTDIAGNVVDGPVVNILVDTLAPSQATNITGGFDDQPGTTGGFANGAVINDSSPTISGTISAPLNSNEVVRIARNGVDVGDAQLNGTNWTFTDSAIAQGQYTYSAVVTDGAANTATPSNSFDFSLDLTAPTAPTINAVTGDDLITGDEAANIIITGNGPAGAALVLNWAGSSQQLAIDSQGSWTATFSNAPAEGRSLVSATVIDGAGNSAEAFRTVVVDTIAPAAPSISAIAVDDLVNAADAGNGITIAGRGEPGTTINVQWDNLRGNATVSTAGFWSLSFESVPAEGATIVRASATDAGGNTSDTTERSVVVDTIAPNAPQIFDVEQNNAIDATEAADGILIQGLAEAGSIINVVWAGQSRTTTTDNNGNWQVTFENVPAEGDSAIEVTARDSAGNTSAPSQRTVSVNTTLPPPQPEIFSIAADDVVNLAEGEAGVTISGISQAGALVSVSWNGNGSASSTQSATADARGNWSTSFATASIPGDGSSSVTAVASNAGGSSSPTTRTVQIDRTPPDAPQILVLSDDDTIDFSDAAAGITIQGTAQPGSAIAVAWDTFNGQATTQIDGRWSLPVAPAQLPGDGASSISATAKDAVGNTSDSSSRTVTINSVAPPPAPQIGTVEGDNTVNIAEAAAGVQISGSSSAGAGVTVDWASEIQTTTAAPSGAWTVTYPQSLVPDGPATTVSVIASNSGGNSQAATTQISIDRIAPDAPTINPVSGDNVIEASETGLPIAVRGAAQAGSAVEVSWGNASQGITASGSGDWAVSFDRVPVDAGQSDIIATATDSAGNQSIASARTVTVNSVPPPAMPTIVTVGGDDIVNEQEAANGVRVSGSAEARSMVTITWGENEEQATAASNGAWSVVFASDALPADGTVSIAAVASNATGDSDTAQREVSLDRAAPAAPVFADVAGDNIIDAIEAGDSIDVSGTAQTGSSVTVTWGNQTRDTSTGSNGNWTVTFNEIPVSDGDSIIQASATDAAGNQGATANQPVTVNSVAAPDAPTILPIGSADIVNIADAAGGILVSGTATAGATVAVTWAQATESTIVTPAGAWSVTFVPGQFADEGGNTLSVVASNIGGSTDPVTRDFTLDLTAPDAPVILTVGGDDDISPEEAEASIVVAGRGDAGNDVLVAWGSVERTATVDGNGNWEVSFAAVPVDTGASNISAVQTDAAGNASATGSRAITVTEAPPIAVSAPTLSAVADDNIVNASEANAGVTVAGSADADSEITLTWGAETFEIQADSAGAWAIEVAATELPADGQTQLTALATVDDVQSESSAVDVRIDTTAPAQIVTIADLLDDAAPQIGSIEDGDTTNDTQPVVELTLDSLLASDESIMLYDNGEQIAALPGEALTLELPVLDQGEHSLTARVVDTAQNLGALSDPLNFVVDNVP